MTDRCERINGLAVSALLLLLCCQCIAQGTPQERTFPQSKAAIEKTIKTLQSSLSGRLPTLEGFAIRGDRPLERFQRGYYQCSVEVSPTASGGSLVKVSAKVTAWYSDPEASRSGYRVLPSNGRLEADLLNQLEDALGKPSASTQSSQTSAAASKSSRTVADNNEPSISAPEPNLPKSKDPLASTLSRIAKEKTQPASTAKQPSDQHLEQLRSELKNLQEILKNQSHPNNLAAVKKAGTPIVSGPRLDAKVLFYAALQDEFEILDTTSDWVHVRISGLSRGWIRRSSVEMPDSENEVQSASSVSERSGPFFVTREETAPFAGDWPPLRGKTVKIISVQKTDEHSRQTPQAKLDYAASLLGDKFRDLAQASPVVAGVMVIFDSADGGMMAATLPALQQWKAGRLSNDALWRQCYFDPPDTFAMSADR